MADLILKQIWNWFSSGWSNMADLADRIDDLICSFEGGAETTMDTIAMLIFGWMIFGLFVLGIGRYIYGRFIASSESKEKSVVAPVPAPVVAAPSVSEEAAVSKDAPKATVSAAPRSSGVSRSSGAVVPPTPPVRKRISTKKGSGPTPSPSRTLHYIQPPVATGPESESVQWVNDVFAWLYSDSVIVNEVLNVWIQALNDFTKQSVAEHGVGVEFVRVLPESHAPSLTNVFSECASNDDVTITCDCEAMPAMQVKAFRQRGEKVEVSHFRVNVSRFRARLSIVCVTEKLLADVKCDGWPDIKVALAPVGTIKNSMDEQQLQEVLTEIIVVALRNTEVNLNFGEYPSCPRLVRQRATPPHVLPVHYDSMLGTTQYSSIPSKTAIDKRLLVKVIKASSLGAKQGCHEPYCVVEMDEPPQKNSTSVKKDTNSPNWDEHFLFDLSPNTAEILFEIYDRANKSRFLGLGIVGVEELLINPSQRQIISLQSRPYEEDEVSGTLTVEFLFIEGADIPQLGDKPYKLKETLRTVSPSGGVVTTTKTVFSKPGDRLFPTGSPNARSSPQPIRGSYGQSQQLTNGGDVVTDSALKELEARNKVGPTQTSKSTLIIHSVQRQPQHKTLKVEQTDAGKWYEVTDQVDNKQGTRETIAPPPAPQDGVQGGSPPSGTDDRGRSRKKKRDFFGTIKKRLSRSKLRSKSMDPGERDESLNRDASLSRSISADRARDPSAHSTAYLSVPGLRDLDGSTRSSLSEASGVSGASTRTYVNEASTLVLETIENGVKKHYLVPLSIAQKSKWRKKGVKLHIFNDHTFIAKHLAGGTTCQVCSKSVARRLGKQGYECRDCELKCHKHCHIKVDSNCTNSTIQSIELQYIQSPYMDRRVLQLQKS